jgi:small subunit ribosomal protein S16
MIIHAATINPTHPTFPRRLDLSRPKCTPRISALTQSHRTARNSKPLEVIGTYDPIPKPDPYDDSGKLHKDIRIDSARAKYWIGVGAQPTDTAWRLLSMLGILPKKEYGPVEREVKEIPAEGARLR